MFKKIKNNVFLQLILFPIIFLRRIYIRFKNRKIVSFNYLFSNVKEGSIIVNLIDIPGDFEIDVRSHLLQRILTSKNYEPEIVSVIQKHIDIKKDAIDIGANIGLYACLLANLINDDRKVLAAEPTPLAYKYLKNNIERNKKVDKVKLYNGVCTNITGNYTLNTVVGKEEYSSLGETNYISDLKEDIVKLEIKGETIDNLVDQFNLEPGLILIDVEGAEMKVLEGAINILKYFKPVIIFELADIFLSKQGTSSRQVIEFLKSFGYEVKNIDSKGILQYPFCGTVIALAN